MSAPQSVTANFSLAPTTLSAVISSQSGPSSARLWTITITNSGPGLANGTQINALSLTRASGKRCTPVVNTPFPVSVGDLGPGASGNGAVTIDFSSCAANTTFNVSIPLSANAGATTATVALRKQGQ